MLAKTSVEAECKEVKSARRQGERSEMKHILLCAVPKVSECKKCSEQIRRNAWNEVTGGTGTLFENFNDIGKGKCNDERSGSCLLNSLSPRLQSNFKRRIMR